MLIILFVIIFFSFYKKLFVFLIILLFSGVLEYITNRNQIKINLGHVFFFSIILTRLDSILLGILLIIFGGFFPQILVGNIDLKNIVAYPMQILAIIMFHFFANIDMPFPILGILLAFFCYSITFIAAKAGGEPLPELITEIAFPFILNIIYFLSFEASVITILGKVIGI